MSLTLLFNVAVPSVVTPPVTPPAGVTPGIFPALPNALDPYRVTLGFRTDIIQSYTENEQRIQLRRIPRLRQSYVARALAPADMARLDTLAVGGQTQQWILPYWPHGSLLTAGAGPGASTLLCDTSDRDFVNGGLVVLWRDSGTAESATITSLAAGQIGCTLVNAWPVGTFVIPARLARWANDARARRIMRGGSDAALTFDFEGLVDPGVATPAPALFTVGYPDRFRQEPEDQQHRSVERFDSPTGAFADYARGASPLGRYKVALYLGSKADVNNLLTWYYGQKGALAPFYFPTRQPDLPLASPIGVADGTITITKIGYTAQLFPLAQRRQIGLAGVDGTITMRLVTASVDNGNGTETLTLDSAAGVAVPIDGTVCFVLYVRLSEDPLMIDWINGTLAETTLDVTELRQAAPDSTLVHSSPPLPGVTLPPPPPPAPQPGPTLSPTAVANGPYAAIAGNTVVLSALGSSDPYGAILVAIDPGDGTGYLAAPALTLSHVYVAGSYTMRVRVTSQKTGLVATAVAAVTIAASGSVVVDHVTVTPSSLTGQVGGAARPIAIAYDASGRDITGSVVVSWTTSNAAVVAAPANGPSPTVPYLAAGSANLQATAGGVSSPLVPVTVTAAPTSTGLLPDLPAGYVIPSGYAIDLHTLPDGVYTKVYAVSFRDTTTYVPSGARAPVNPPASPPMVAEVLFPVGMQAGIEAGGWVTEDFTFRGWHGLYLSGFFQLSSNFRYEAAGVQKMMIANIHGDPCLVVMAYFGKWQTNLQDIVGANGIKGGAVNLAPNKGRSAAVTLGLWQHVEVQVVSNTPGVANGITRLWLTNFDANGRKVSGPSLVSEYTDVIWSSATQANVWQGASCSPIYGGNAGDKVPVQQYMWCDHFAVGGSV